MDQNCVVWEPEEMPDLGAQADGRLVFGNLLLRWHKESVGNELVGMFQQFFYLNRRKTPAFRPGDIRRQMALLKYICRI